jgi:hypothetical protein
MRNGNSSGSLFDLNTNALYGDAADTHKGTHGPALHGHGDDSEEEQEEGHHHGHDHRRDRQHVHGEDEEHTEEESTDNSQQNQNAESEFNEDEYYADPEGQEKQEKPGQEPGSKKPAEPNMFNRLMASLSEGASALTDAAGGLLKEQLLGIPKDAKIFFNKETKEHGYRHTSIDANGNTAEKKVTFSGKESSRNEFTTVTNPDGQRLSETNAFKSTDGSEWGTRKTWRADGTKESEGQFYMNPEEHGGSGQRTIWHDANGNIGTMEQRIRDVIAFDNTDDGISNFEGGTANVQRVDLNGKISDNINSVIDFGDRNAQGQRTRDSGVNNLHAINPNAQMSSNINTVINFGDTANGAKTFDSGRQNIHSVNPNGTIKDNINAVASFSDTPNATLAAMANAGAALAGLKGKSVSPGAGTGPSAVATTGVGAGITGSAGAGAGSAQAQGKGALVELPALNAARIAADVTLTDRQDPTAVATDEVPAPTPKLKSKYA